MKRDMELIRQILQATEALEFQDGEPPEHYSAKSYDEAYQIALMQDAGLVEADVTTANMGLPEAATVFRMTWAGHDFLDSTRDSKIWEAAKNKIIKSGVSWTFSLLVEWLKQEARQKLFGVPLSK